MLLAHPYASRGLGLLRPPASARMLPFAIAMMTSAPRRHDANHFLTFQFDVSAHGSSAGRAARRQHQHRSRVSQPELHSSAATIDGECAVVPFAASRTMLIAVHAYSGRVGFASLNSRPLRDRRWGALAAPGMRSPSRPWALSGNSPSRQDNGRSERRPASHLAACSVAFTVWFVVLATGRRGGANAAAARSLLEVWLVIERPKPTGLASCAICVARLRRAAPRAEHE
jgi:hypothetical protein